MDRPLNAAEATYILLNSPPCQAMLRFSKVLTDDVLLRRLFGEVLYLRLIWSHSRWWN